MSANHDHPLAFSQYSRQRHCSAIALCTAIAETNQCDGNKMVKPVWLARIECGENEFCFQCV